MTHFWSENMLLQKIGETVTKKPLAIVVGVIVITILMVAQMALNPQDGTVSQSSFLPDNEVISALEDIGYKFVTEYPVDILVYSKNNDILTSDAFVDPLHYSLHRFFDRSLNGPLHDKHS
jgi:predicted RND superfamily exporter protein